MNELGYDEKINYLLAEIDRLSDRVKTLESIEQIVIDDELNESSTNPVENGIVATAIDSCAKSDASNLTSANVTSFNAKLGVDSIVSTAVSNRAKCDASNLTSANVTSFNAKLGVDDLADEIDTCAKCDASNLTSANVTSFNAKLGVDDLADEIDTCAKCDASNLTTANVTSFNAKLGTDSIVSTAVSNRAKCDASNLTTENVTSFNAKLGVDDLADEIDTCAKCDASNLTTENVTSFNAKLGVDDLADEIDTCAKCDASNLTTENVTSFNAKLGVDDLVDEIDTCAKCDASNLTTENVTSFNEVLGTEMLETIYDKTNANSSLNWGYTSGIKSGVEVTKATGYFGNYKGLYVYATCANTELSFFLDLEKLNSVKNNYNGASCGLTGSYGAIACVKTEVDATKSKFKNTAMGYYITSFTLLNNDSSYYIYKIKGVN